MKRWIAGIGKTMLIAGLAGSLLLHWWSLWMVGIWAVAFGLLFSITDRYHWYITKMGCDIFGSGVLLLGLLGLVHFAPTHLIAHIASNAVELFCLYFAVIGLYHLTQIARNHGYKYPIAVVIGEPLFRYVYRGIENVKGE